MLHKIMHRMYQTSSGTYSKIQAYISKFELLICNECSTAKINLLSISTASTFFFCVHGNSSFSPKGWH